MIVINTSKLRNWTLAVLFTVFAGGSTVATVAPMTVSAATFYTCSTAPSLLTFPPWYRNLSASASDCNLASPDAVGGLSAFIWIIVLNVIEIGLQLVAYIAVGFIIYGGFQFMTSQGSPEGSAKGRKTILNAVIGLVISFASIGAVNLIAEVLK